VYLNYLFNVLVSFYKFGGIVKFHSLEQLISLSYYRFYLSGDPWEILFCIVNELCWNCLVYCFHKFVFK